MFEIFAVGLQMTIKLNQVKSTVATRRSIAFGCALTRPSLRRSVGCLTPCRCSRLPCGPRRAPSRPSSSCPAAVSSRTGRSCSAPVGRGPSRSRIGTAAYLRALVRRYSGAALRVRTARAQPPISSRRRPNSQRSVFAYWYNLYVGVA